LGDDKLIRLGDSQDLSIYHNGSNSYIDESGTGALIFKSNIHSFRNAADSAQIAKFTESDAVELYWGGTDAGLRLETTQAGITIQGEGRFVGGDLIAFAASDKRLKDNIKPIEDPLAKILSISGNTFDWNSASGKEGSDTGVIAQEVDALNLPGITTIRDDGTYAVRYERLVPVLIEAIKELSAKVDNLEQKLSDK